MQVGVEVFRIPADMAANYKSCSIRQFQAPYDGLAGVSLFMATYGRKNDLDWRSAFIKPRE